MFRGASAFLLILILAGCGPSPAAPAPSAVPSMASTAAGATQGCAKTGCRTITAPAPEKTAYPVQTGEPDQKTEPVAQTPAPGIKSAGAGSAGFHDCARTPALAGCGEQGLAAPGFLAISERNAARLVVLDLTKGAGWQAPGPPGGLAWSPDGAQLLTWRDTEGGRQSQLWSAGGARLGEPQTDEVLRWQPDGSLGPASALRVAGKFQAALDQRGSTWQLVVHEASGAERSLALPEQTADRQLLLLDHVPGRELVILQAFFTGNLSLAAGGELSTLDLASGAVQPLKLSAPLGSSAGLAWSPSQQERLALLASGTEPGLTRLALLDFETGKIELPTPEGLQVSSLSWQPDGKRLVFTAEPLPGGLTLAETKQYPGPGIYALDAKTGKIDLLLASPGGAAEGWVRWSADGQALLHARLIRDAQGRAQGEVRLFRPRTGQDAALFTGLAFPGIPERVDWPALLAYSGK